MIVEYIRYGIIDTDRRAEFERSYERAAESLDASPHCLSYELTHGVEEPEHYVLRIEWDSLEGHEQVSFEPRVPDFLCQLSSLCREHTGDAALRDRRSAV